MATPYAVPAPDDAPVNRAYAVPAPDDAPSDGYTPTQYGFKVRPIDIGNGKQSVQREDGAVYFGPDQGNKGTPGWFDANGQRKSLSNDGGDAPGFWSSLVKQGLPTAGKSFMQAVSQMSMGHADPRQANNPDNPINKMNQQVASDVAGLDRETEQGGYRAKAGSGVGHWAPAALATAFTGGQSAPTFLGRLGQGALPTAGSMYALTPGSELEKSKSAAVGVATLPVGQALGERVITPLAGATVRGAKTLVGKVSSLIPSRSVATAAEESILPGLQSSFQTPTATPVTAEAQQELGALIKKASGNGIGSTAAKGQLAEMANVNQQARAAAEKLGMDLPADVFSDNPQIRAAAGLTRSVAGSEPEAAWRTTVMNAVDRADDALRQFDTNFVEGQVSPGSVSEKVRTSLIKTKAGIDGQAGKIYEAVDKTVPRETPIELPNLQALLDTVKGEVGAGGMSKQEAKLVSMLSSDEGVTYGRLIREKSLIGQAIGGMKSPYGDMETGALKRLYGALSEDQMHNVANIAGDDAAKQLRSANLLTAKSKALGSRIVGAFGNDLDGGIASKMRAAITSASKGDSGDFAKLMKLVPEDLRKETIATALASVTRSTRGVERGGFGFSEFAKTYQGLKANPNVYDKVVEALGPESKEVMDALFEVSRRVSEARANVLTTGKANQGLLQALNAESLTTKVMNSALAKGGATAAASVGGGPIAAGAASALTNMLSGGKKDAVLAAGKLFASEEFKALTAEAATKPKVTNNAILAVANSQKFKDFAKAANFNVSGNQGFAWVTNALRTPPISKAADNGTTDQLAQK